MSTIMKRWLSEQCRIEDGIFFSDDTYIPLVGNVPQPPRRSISPLLANSPDDWSSIHVEQLAALPGYKVFGGDTSWEGAGFIALVRESDGSLIWLLHSEQSEPFRSASIDGELIVALSREDGLQNPLYTFRWAIPVTAPWLLTVVAGNA